MGATHPESRPTVSSAPRGCCEIRGPRPTAGPRHASARGRSPGRPAAETWGKLRLVAGPRVPASPPWDWFPRRKGTRGQLPTRPPARGSVVPGSALRPRSGPAQGVRAGVRGHLVSRCEAGPERRERRAGRRPRPGVSLSASGMNTSTSHCAGGSVTPPNASFSQAQTKAPTPVRSHPSARTPLRGRNCGCKAFATSRCVRVLRQRRGSSP